MDTHVYRFAWRDFRLAPLAVNIVRRDVMHMKKLNGSHLGNTIVIIAVLVIPLLYAGLLTLTYQDPTHRLGTMTAAIVNSDSPVTAELVNGEEETFSLGSELESALLEPRKGEDVGFTWKAMSAQEAESRMRTEDVRAILYIPEDFSKNVSRLATDERDEATTQELRLVTDDSINYLAGTMAQSVAEEMTNRINEHGATRIANHLILSIQSVRTGLVRAQEGADTLQQGSDTLSLGIADLQTGSVTLSSGLEVLDTGAHTALTGALELSSGLNRLAEGAQQTSAGSGDLADATVRLADGTASLTEQAGHMASGVGQLASGASSALNASGAIDEGAAAINEGAKRLDDALNRSEGGAPSLKEGAASVAGGLAAVHSELMEMDGFSLGAAIQSGEQLESSIASYSGTVDQLAAACAAAADQSTTCQTLRELSAQSPNLNHGARQLNTALVAADTTLNEKLASMSEALVQLVSGAQSVSEGVGAAATGASQLSLGSSELSEAAHQLNSGLSAVSQGLSDLETKTPHLASGVEAVDAGAQRISDGTSQIFEALQSLSRGSSSAATNTSGLVSGLNELAQGTSSAAQGASALADGMSTAQLGASTLAKGSGTLSEELDKGTNRIPLLNEAERSHSAEVAGKLVDVESDRLNGVVNNGAGFTPMFMSLSLWVGAIALFLILPALDKRPHAERWWKSATRPAATALFLAIGQAVIMMLVVNAVGELHAANILGLCAMAIATSLCFVAVNQACVAAFAFRGRFLSIVLLSLQITSMGATFPIETAPRFFQWIHPLLPMSYTQLSFRALISGGAGVDGTIEKTLMILFLWTVAAILVTFMAAKKRRGGCPLPVDNALAPTAA